MSRKKLDDVCVSQNMSKLHNKSGYERFRLISLGEKLWQFRLIPSSSSLRRRRRHSVTYNSKERDESTPVENE